MRLFNIVSGMILLALFTALMIVPAQAQDELRFEATATVMDLEAAEDPGPGYYFIDRNGVKHQLAGLQVQEQKEGMFSFGYFYDVSDKEVYRGFGLTLAKKKVSKIPLTLMAGGLMESMDIGDLDGKFIVTTELGSVLDAAGWEFTYSEKIQIGPYFSFFRDSGYGMFATARW